MHRKGLLTALLLFLAVVLLADCAIFSKKIGCSCCCDEDKKE